MKTKLLFLLGVLFFWNFKAQIVNIPDAKFKSRLLQANTTNKLFAKDLNGNWTVVDTNLNGEIEVSEAENISYLDMSSYDLPITVENSIKSFEGINSFKNIVSFVPGMNIGFTSISLNNLTKLVYLEISHTQSLKTLDLAGTNNIEVLNIFASGIENLNVSTLPKLKSLNCDYNNLMTSLDTSSNTQLETLNISSSGIKNLNIKNTKIQSVNFNSLTPLQKICCDLDELSTINSQLQNVGNTSCQTSIDCQFLSTSDNIKSEISIFPNPVKDILTFKTSEKVKKAEIYDVNGRLQKVELGISNNQLNVSTLKTGNYILKVSTDNKSYQTKFIKQ